MAVQAYKPAGADIRERMLIKRSQKGDKAAFEELALLYQQRIYCIALKMINQAEDAADATQETLLKMYRALPKFRGEAAFSTWVYRITVNTCRDILRSGYRQKEGLPLDFGDNEDDNISREVADYSCLPEDVFLEHETEHYLQALIDGLALKYRLVITLRELSALSYQEIADTLHISLGTVKSRLSRARQYLQEQVARDAEQYPHLRRLISERGLEDGLR